MMQQVSQRFLIASLAMGLLACGSTSAFAQGSSLFSGSGLTRGGTGGISGSLGGSGFGSMTGGSGAGGLSSAGGMGGMGGMAGGSNPFALGGQGGLGQTGFGGAGATGFGTTGAAGNQGFTGRTSTGFAGNSRAGQTGGLGGGQTRNFNIGGNNSRRNSDLNNGNAQTEKRTSSIRPRLRVAFDYNTKPATTVVGKVSAHMERISFKNPSLKNVAVQGEGGNFVLTGKVLTIDQSKLAENLLRQEPGVRSIKNELVIEQPEIVE